MQGEEFARSTACQTCKQCKTTLPDSNFSVRRLQSGTGKRSPEHLVATQLVYVTQADRAHTMTVKLYYAQVLRQDSLESITHTEILLTQFWH